MPRQLCTYGEYVLVTMPQALRKRFDPQAYLTHHVQGGLQNVGGICFEVIDFSEHICNTIKPTIQRQQLFSSLRHHDRMLGGAKLPARYRLVVYHGLDCRLRTLCFPWVAFAVPPDPLG